MIMPFELSSFIGKDWAVWDFDDTFANTRTHNENMWVKTIAQVLNVDFSVEKILEIARVNKGASCRDIAAIMIANTDISLLTPKMIDKVVEENAIMNSENIINVTLFKYFEQALQTLTAMRINVAICTNRDEKTVRSVLDRYGLAKLFAFVLSAADLNKPKPDPYTLNMIIEGEQLDPTRVIYIGDNQTDEEFAKRAKVDCIIVEHFKDETVFPFQALAITS